jgi:hypothetical protein
MEQVAALTDQMLKEDLGIKAVGTRLKLISAIDKLIYL